MGNSLVSADEGTREMTDNESDAVGALSGSVLVTGPAPERFDRAAELLTDEVVVVPGVDGELEATLTATDLRATTPQSGGVTPLSDLGIAVSDLVTAQSRSDVLVDADPIAAEASVCPFSLFRFLHLTRWRVAAAGGRFVCTLGDAVDPITVETVDELFDERVRLESDRDRRAIGELSP